MTAIQLDPIAVSAAPLLRAIRVGDFATRAELAYRAGRLANNIARDLKSLLNAGLINDTPGGDAAAISLTSAGYDQLDAIDLAERGWDKPGSPEASSAMAGAGIMFLRHDQIVPDPDNAREDWDSDDARADLEGLSVDIAERGKTLQNLIVKHGPDGDREPLYMLVGGERRWRAIGLAIERGAWPEDRLILCVLNEGDDLDHYSAALAENIQRRKLNPLERARAFERLAAGLRTRGVEDANINREIADRARVTIEHVQQHRSFLRLDEEDLKRLALPDKDPRRLSVSDARKKISDLNKAEAARDELLAIPVDERLALAEVLHAVSVRGKYSYDSITVRAGAAESKVGQALAAMNWVKFEGPVSHGDRIGHYVASRGHAVPNAIGEPYWTGSEASREAQLRGDQSFAGHPDRSDYVTEWLNGPFELDDAGRAAVAADERYKAERQAQEDFAAEHRAANEAAKAAAIERQRAVALRSRDLFAAHRTAAPKAEDVVALAMEADAPLPWRMNHRGDVVAADGSTIIGGRTDDRAEARMRLLILAMNATAGVETPEDEPDPNPILDHEAFVALMTESLKAQDRAQIDAATILDDMLENGGVEYGDEGFDWTPEGALHLVTEYLAGADDADGDDAEATA